MNRANFNGMQYVNFLSLQDMNSKSKVYECNVHRALAQQQIYIRLQKIYNDYSCAGLDPLG